MLRLRRFTRRLRFQVRLFNIPESSLIFHDSGAVEAGYFITSFLVVSGFGIILVMAHASLISVSAMVLSLFGGAITYATILGYIHFVSSDDSSF